MFGFRHCSIIHQNDFCMFFFNFQGEHCRLNGKDVVQHITAILKNQDMNNMFVADYQNILLKFILSSKTYRCEITCKMWHGKFLNFVEYI